MEIETKSLRLQLSNGKVEQDYNLELDLPDKEQLIHLLELPPHYILSKNEFTFEHGILGQMPHAMKLMISRDYQDLYLGLFVNIGDKTDQQVTIAEIKGIFQPLDENNAQLPTPPTATVDPAPEPDDAPVEPEIRHNLRQHVPWNAGFQPIILPHPSGLLHEHPVRVVNMSSSWLNPNIAQAHPPNFNPHNMTYHPSYHTRISRMGGSGMLFSFQKQNPEMRLDDLKQFQHYYRSYSHTWPVKRVRVKLTIKVVGIKYSAIIDDEDNLPDFKPPSSMFNAEQFYMSEYCSDIKLKVGSAVIPGHKIVLSARSEFFNRMFSNNMRETVEGIVELGDEDETLFGELIRFVYLGKVEDIDEHVNELFVLADKYQIEELGCYCEKYLLAKLSVDNVMELFDLSQSVGRQGPLAKRSKELIMWNKEKFAPDLDTFKEFFNKYPELIFEILKL